jgi:hypothetical protein
MKNHRSWHRADQPEWECDCRAGRLIRPLGDEFRAFRLCVAFLVYDLIQKICSENGLVYDLTEIDRVRHLPRETTLKVPPPAKPPHIMESPMEPNGRPSYATANQLTNTLTPSPTKGPATRPAAHTATIRSLNQPAWETVTSSTRPRTKKTSRPFLDRASIAKSALAA